VALRVLKRPEIPLQNNAIESDIREFVKRRKIGFAFSRHIVRQITRWRCNVPLTSGALAGRAKLAADVVPSYSLI